MPYIYQIIFGLDQALEDDALLLRDILKQYKVNNYIIQWNDGPIFSQIYKVLNEAGFVFLEPGKGKNIFLSFGIALALGAKVVGVLDADIRYNYISGKKIKRDFFETPQTVSWDRITKKLPNIFEDLNKAIRQEKNLLS